MHADMNTEFRRELKLALPFSFLIFTTRDLRANEIVVCTIATMYKLNTTEGEIIFDLDRSSVDSVTSYLLATNKLDRASLFSTLEAALARISSPILFVAVLVDDFSCSSFRFLFSPFDFL